MQFGFSIADSWVQIELLMHNIVSDSEAWEMSAVHHIERFSLYFTTKRLHEEYRVSSGQYRWIYRQY